MENAFGGEADRPAFRAAAPALLGFDSTIWEFCSRASGATTQGGFSQQELANRCVRSNNNILRIVGNAKW